MRATTPVFLFLASAALASASYADIERRDSETLDLAGIERVEIRVGSGSLTLLGESRRDLQLDVTKRFKAQSESEADEIEQSIVRTVERRGDRLVIEISYERSFWKGLFGDEYGVSLDVALALPNSLRVEARCDGGHIDARDLNGGLELMANGGHIEVSGASGEVEAHANGGPIRLDGFSGKAELQSNGGRVEAFCSGPSAIEATANGGGVAAAFEQGLSGETELTSRGGSVSARLPKDARFDLEASARGGSVHFEHEGALAGDSTPSAIEGRVNGGGPSLELSAAGGSVTVARL